MSDNSKNVYIIVWLSICMTLIALSVTIGAVAQHDSDNQVKIEQIRKGNDADKNKQ